RARARFGWWGPPPRPFFPGKRRRRRLAVLDREERRAGSAIEHEHLSELRHLRDGINRSAVALHGDEAGRRGKIPVPDIVLEALEVPEPLSGARVKGEHAIRKQVVAMPCRSEEIDRRGSRGGEHHAELLIDGDPGPGVCATG